LANHTNQINSLTTLSNGWLVSASSDRFIKIWEPTSGGLIQTLSGHSGSVLSLIVLRNGYLASGSSDNTIKGLKKNVT